MGTDVLFENHTIKEIQEIEKKLRNDIERKKEELRQMVGERYRDLMEAADTITEMKDIAESVTSRIKSIEGRCNHLQYGSLQNGILNSIQEKVAEKRRINDSLYAVASQIKILMDSPTKIWSSIESKDFVSAVSLFLLARHTHSLLVLDPVYQELKVTSQFPIVVRQWTSINHLKHVLMQNCQVVLETQNVEPEHVVGPLCCTCLLSSSSMEQILIDILHIRKNVLKSIFRPEKMAKDQICEFVAVVQLTIKMVYIVLYSEEERTGTSACKTNLLYETLQRVISKEEPGPVSLLDLKSSETFRFVPSNIADFRPALNFPIVPCSPQFLRLKCNEWLNDVKNTFHSELLNLLKFVNSVERIAVIREAVFRSLYEEKYWNEICMNLLNMPFSIWDFFLKKCFFQRIRDITDECVRNAGDFCLNEVEQTLHGGFFESESNAFELEIPLYVWKESPNDVMDNVAWLPRHQRNFWNSGELSMKSMGFTPKLQSICKDLDQQMENAVVDISHFSFLHEELSGSSDNGIDVSIRQHLSNFPEDVADIYKYLMEAVERTISDLASYIETTLLYLENEKDNYENNFRIVFLGRLCYGIANLCPHINICLACEKLQDVVAKQREKSRKLHLKFNMLKENELWKELKNKLLEICASAFRLWSKCRINYVIKSIESELITSSAGGLLKALLQWDKVEIQEESEQGNSVKSVLRIPQHISMPLSNALFAFCCKINSVGGYSISSEVRSHISKQLLIGLLEVYKKKIDANLSSEEINPRMLQVQSLQLLFDVQFLMGLMVYKESSCDFINESSQYIISQAMSHIDPFDMDVFATPLQHNLKKALQKSLSLFGLIASADQISYLSGIKGQSVMSHMEHNVMLSSNNGSRFPLLPLSSRATMSNECDDRFLPESKETEVMILQSHNSSPNLRASDMPPNPMKSTSFYDKFTAMSSSWFGN